MPETMLDQRGIASLWLRENERFNSEHPRSKELFERACRSLPDGVPMNWMAKWPGSHPIFASHAHGSRLTDVDGIEYVDFCFGDTGAMGGHSPAGSVSAIQGQAADGITCMLPSEDAVWVGEEMARRFGLPYWQFCLSATDANRFSLRLAREITGRSKVVVFNYCYHGSVDESLITTVDGETSARRGNIGPACDPTETTRVIEFNDLPALEVALAEGDVAAVLAEPALTNIGIVLPEDGFHEAMRDLCDRYGALLIIDETHTICAGPGGYTAAHGLKPDMLTIGKAIASGVPAAAYGFSEGLLEKVQHACDLEDTDVSGVGGTLSGNALSLASIRATLSEVLTKEAFERMVKLGIKLETEVNRLIDQYRMPWHVTRLGCRIEYVFSPTYPKNGSEAADAGNFELDRLIHLYMLNRGVLLTPFHNMALASPATDESDVERHTEVLGSLIHELTDKE